MDYNLKRIFNSYNEIKEDIAKKYEGNRLLVDGISGFKFSILKNRSVKLGSEITDYITENNAKIQDHISLNPIILELSGFMGEIVEESPKDLKYQKLLQSKLNEFGGFLPELSVQAQEYFEKAKVLKAKAESILDVMDNVENFLGHLQELYRKRSDKGSGSDDEPKTEIRGAYGILSAAWRSRKLLTVQTEFEELTNMAIQSLEFSRNSDEKYKSDIKVIMKQITLTQVQQNKGTERITGQKSSDVNQGEVCYNPTERFSNK
jgi:hypothetical protein